MPFLLLNNHDCDLDCKLRNKRFDEKNINCLSNYEVSITSYSPETLHAMHSKRFTICTFDVTLNGPRSGLHRGDKRQLNIVIVC